MRHLLLTAMLLFAFSPLSAQAQFKVLGEAETTWPGIRYQVFWLSRIAPDRLVVGIRILATAQAPAKGTLIGYPVPIPAKPSEYDLRMGNFRPRPFSLASSIMIDDATQQQYPVLAPISPPGKEYRPAIILGSLTPGQALVLTVQFAVPPPPPPPQAGQPPLKQTLSFQLTNGKDLIRKIPIPPLGK